MKKTLLQQKKELLKQYLPKPTYNPAQQFKHRDRGTKVGRKSWYRINALSTSQSPFHLRR